jgi:DNA-binding CsgD family transcriptional regulator
MVERMAIVEREVYASCSASWPPREFAASLSEALRPVVPHDGYCLFGFDPLTGLTSFHASRNGYLETLRDCNRLWQNEQLEDDLNRFSALAAGPSPVGLLGTDDPAERRSARRHEIMPLAGYGSEMRVALVAGKTLCGALVLLRERRRRTFSSAEAACLAQLAPRLGQAIRKMSVSCLPAESRGMPGTGVVLLSPDNTPEESSAEAREWLRQLTGAAEDKATLEVAMLHLANAARADAANGRSSMPQCRVRTTSGKHAVMQASLLGHGPKARVALVIQRDPYPTPPSLIAARYGLTPREQEVVHLALAGLSNKRIARQLGVSPYTVNDHLKSIFEKTGARGRYQLIAAFKR